MINVPVDTHHLAAAGCFILGLILIKVGLKHESFVPMSGDGECAAGTILVILSVLYAMRYIFILFGF